jgi:phage shock protein PspC (stress-responsive transcriptional regulator)
MLTRDPYNGTIAGVCAGLGEYFGIDPIFFRISFLVSFLCFGFGVLPYLIFWLLMPTKE